MSTTTDGRPPTGSPDLIDGHVRDGDPAPHVDVFTVGVDGIGDVPTLVELADRLGCAAIVDARTKLPTRTAWSTRALKIAFGGRYRIATAGVEPLAGLKAGGPRTLVLFKHAGVNVPHKVRVGDARADLAVRHLFLPEAAGVGSAWAFSNEDAHRLGEDVDADRDVSWAAQPLVAESWFIEQAENRAVRAAPSPSEDAPDPLDTGGLPAARSTRSTAPAAMAAEAGVSSAAVLAGLKDFQRRTVDWVFDRLYAPGSSGRFLVADEVGLGKTLVARGVIARAVDYLRGKVKRIDVLYICSNSDIARQNIQRLKLDGDGHMTLASRLTMLPLEVGKLKETQSGVNFISFTPQTSFDVRDGLGQARERVLLYWMVREAWALGGGKAIQHVFRGYVGPERFAALVDCFERGRIDGDAQQAFTKALSVRLATDREDGVVDLRQRFDDLCRAYSRSDRTIDQETSRSRNRFIGDLRNVLAASCVEPLKPDLVILDEFQRFSHLLDDTEDDASVLARAVFEYPEVRVLLLSATPYKMYTLTDESEDHYRDFVRTARFLEGKNGKGPAIEHDLEEYRAALLALTQAEGPERLRVANRTLEQRLRRVMVRTERLASTPDRNGMLKEVAATPLELRASDALDYVAVQGVARAVEQHDALDYWKSTPYVLNFLDDSYKLKSELRQRLETADGRSQIARALSVSPTATLRWEDVHAYREVEPGNPRMRALVRDFLDAGAHRLLWIPPSMPYYALGGAFADPAVARLTKRLIFSSWKVVPRAISAMMSYEVERRVFGADRAAEYTPEYRAKRSPALRFSRTDGRLTGMAVLALLYPSLYLAEACDPAALAVEIAQERTREDRPWSVREVSAEDVLEGARVRIQLALQRHLPVAQTDGPVDERWYWAAPLLLDRKLKQAATLAWFQQEDLAHAWSGADAAEDTEEVEERTRDHWAEHVKAARDVALGGAEAVTSAEGPTALGRMPEDLVEVLAQLALGGPAVTMFRALLHVVGGESNLDDAAKTALRNGAGAIAWAFRALFNQPEVMALLRGLARDDGSIPYWRQALTYCVDGCLQGVLDEYVHVLRDHLGLLAGSIGERVTEIAAEVIEAIELRTTRVGIDHLARSEAGRTVKRESHNLRTHFALRFGDERSDEGELLTRKEQVRKAFNSPFWPFVLATTSVGQEGLDFHTYCHAVVHWNLPSNPVDYEQREGRVHRYKGHAVRKNIASRYGDEALGDGERDRWQAMFDMACAARPAGESDIVPFWVCLDGEARIERHVPALPLSRDRERGQRLQASLAVYRMVFGQPRQDDLVAYLLQRVPVEEREKLMLELRIDLSPAAAANVTGTGATSTP
jgi:hypothetical protein